MSIVAEAALSAFFKVLFNKLSSSDLLKIFRQENIDADLKKWAMKLRKIRAVLADAEEKQMTDEFVKSWLAELQDLAYDADDILDEFATEALRRELNAEKPSTSTVIKFFNDCVGSDRDFVKQMRSKIEGIDRRLQEIVEEKKDLELRENTGGRTITKTSRPPSTSLVNESRTYGRDEDKKEIVKLLLQSSDAQLSVIPIVGMGGLGKTTLAQLVYKDDEVSRHFELKAWVCVSEDFDNLRLTKEILRSFTSEFCHENNDLDSLQRKLKDTLSGKKFLLILDDVWNENYELWTELCKPFEFGALGSKIVVTTRNDGVSSIMRTTPPYKLKELSRDACLGVFTHHALDATDFSKYPELEEFGQKIVDRCKGAPLAAKALGGLLRTKHDPYEWEDVSNSKIWDIPEDKSSIFSVLKLSYNYLPSCLKRCFAYCSLFPKDYDFQEKKLVLLWMAEGLVQETKEKPMEDLGRDYFRDLLNRSFFQQSSSHESLFVMHDLMHDLAQLAAGNLCYRLEDQFGVSKQFEISTKVRHFSYITYSNDCIIKVADFFKDMRLRTFLPVNCTSGLRNFDANCLLPQLRYLRVLSLGGNEICELPSSIGDLKHLRYLNLSYSKITSLPESTNSLYNLQTLLLEGCSYLTKLPEKIENLVNLRHLDITNADSIIEMPMGIAKLKSLRTLSNFVVGKDKIVDLMNLESLQGTLCISHLENMLDASKVNLKGKKNLDTLVMKWNGDLQTATDILDMLQPHGMMKTLSIEGYVGAKFPTWLGDPYFSNMVDLRIESCRKCMFLPAFGQLPFLKHLVIMEMFEVRSVGLEFYGEHCNQPFRSLVKLCFDLMFKWQDWIPCRVGLKEFPCLRELSISYCILQGELPHHLPSLKKLSIYKCYNLVVSIPSLPMLQEIVLKELKSVRCKDVVDGFVKAEKVKIRDCQEVTSLSLSAQEIIIKSCRSLVNIKLKSTLRTLTIKGCNALESLQFVMDEGGASSTSSLLKNEENLSCIGNNNASLLEHLKISDCYFLTCLSTIIDLAAMLKHLDIENCFDLTSLSSRDTLPTTLKFLRLVGCRKLELIVDRLNKDTLLEQLFIYSCGKLRCLPRDLHKLCHLKKIDIYECNSLISLGDLLPTNLRTLQIVSCEKLEALSNNIHNLNFLQYLLIRGCPSIVSFPKEGFPTNLRELRLSGTNLYKQVFELGLHRLTSLTYLEITIGITDSFPEEEDGKTMLILPTSLTTLRFNNLPNLFLSWNQNLSALETFSINGCPKLASLSEKCFPPSLQLLFITNCPVLKQNCKKDKGIMWSKIANIPSVIIDGREQNREIFLPVLQ